VLFLSFNVTSLLRPGANAVGARLGNSKFGYLDIYTNRTALGDQSGDSSRAFLLVLVATLSDGSEHTLVSTPGGWRSRHGPIVYDHLWHGEIYDARQELDGWSAKPLASFPADSWGPARAMQPRVGRLYPQLMQPIRKVG
jgi:alpha-L-rhamnosidase